LHNIYHTNKNSFGVLAYFLERVQTTQPPWQGKGFNSLPFPFQNKLFLIPGVCYGCAYCQL